VIDENHDSVFIGNIFQHNNNHGILLSNCKNCVIKNNVFDDGGLDLFGFEKEHFIHTIEANTVNGKPLYYFIDKFNFNVPSDAGQIIFVDCDSTRVKNVKINNTSTGILIAFSENIKVERSEFNKNNRGVFLYYSTRCNFNFNNFIDNKFHISFVGKGWFNSKSNKWRYNYYEKIFKTRLFKRIPEPIRGICHLKNRFDRFRIIPFIIVTQFDLRPARYPY
jgi:parallel beta-helix repeat protein